MSESFANGIITFDALEQAVANDTFASLANVDWKPAQVAHKFDTLRIKEAVVKEQRDALAIHPQNVQELTDQLLNLTFPKVLSLVDKYWDLKLKVWSAPQFTLYKKGHFIKIHRDSGEAFPNRLFSVVTYLTADYRGGEIYFPHQKSEYHPSIGQTLIFPADYVHGVNPIQEGEKCIFLYFLDSK